MDNKNYGGYYFSSNFDSGNLDKVELIKLYDDIIASENIVNAEFNVWTKPDCAGTVYENLNRSWFFFGINGGEPFKVCKINVQNLNRQTKLFSQGMHPVMRIGEYGKWERMKDNPVFYNDTENFILSFLHRPLDNNNKTIYYAFTYPFTYTECQRQLEKYDNLYLRRDADLQYIIQRLNNNNNNNNNNYSSTNINENIEKLMHCENDENIEENDATKNQRIDTTVTQQQQQLLSNESDLFVINKCNEYEFNDNGHLIKLTKDELENEIYYHRELLINSVEQRRIDLLTITSFRGIENKYEENLTNLFPDKNIKRCYVFKEKKIIFVSSRVHPGETPASFVLNGFLKLLLDKKSIIASNLRNLYVFKIVPFLNPDGVYNGYYRSDTFGRNLNRFYLNPSLDTQPSIYAAQKLIKYYHNDREILDELENLENKTECVAAETLSKENIDCDIVSGEESSSRSQSSEIELINNEQNIQYEHIIIDNKLKLQDDDDINIIRTKATAPTPTPINDILSVTSGTPIIFKEQLITEIKPTITIDNDINNNNNNDEQMNKDLITFKTPSLAPTKIKTAQFTTNADKITKSTRKEFRNNTNDNNKNNGNNNSNSNNNLINRSNSCPSKLMEDFRIKKRKNYYNSTNINISADFLQEFGNNNNNSQLGQKSIAETSNMFLYIDLHGHASKKGIFMYGNHLPNTLEAVECMLLPKLMSINCHHFHFDACVFSERNMYHRGKNDGLSKEGSGRVAIYKTIGLIKCYTLESNYNTGKYVNILPPRGKETNTKKIGLVPPKYTPIIFEEVGRALGPSILDLTNSNPLSRLQNSDYRSLQGLRNSLRNEIDKTLNRTNNNNNVNVNNTTNTTTTTTINMKKNLSTKKIKRLKKITPSSSLLHASLDISKENKINYKQSEKLWDTNILTPSCSQNVSNISVAGNVSNTCDNGNDTKTLTKLKNINVVRSKILKPTSSIKNIKRTASSSSSSSLLAPNVLHKKRQHIKSLNVVTTTTTASTSTSLSASTIVTTAKNFSKKDVFSIRKKSKNLYDSLSSPQPPPSSTGSTSSSSSSSSSSPVLSSTLAPKLYDQQTLPNKRIKIIKKIKKFVPIDPQQHQHTQPMALHINLLQNDSELNDEIDIDIKLEVDTLASSSSSVSLQKPSAPLSPPLSPPPSTILSSSTSSSFYKYQHFNQQYFNHQNQSSLLLNIDNMNKYDDEPCCSKSLLKHQIVVTTTTTTTTAAVAAATTTTTSTINVPLASTEAAATLSSSPAPSLTTLLHGKKLSSSNTNIKRIRRKKCIISGGSGGGCVGMGISSNSGTNIPPGTGSIIGMTKSLKRNTNIRNDNNNIRLRKKKRILKKSDNNLKFKKSRVFIKKI